jgi:superfamily II DNA or RNA helicase
MGVYPLLENDTCWFLAVDFDKSAWRDDVRAFVSTCRRHELSVAIERSRSGSGAHVWFFFKTPILARIARHMGSYLITETMAGRHELSMASYDRLFPSQDTLPRGGFGNLIALPLQHGPRQQGNSVFLDQELNPIPDEKQWTHLASIPRLETAVIAALAERALRDDAELGVPPAEIAEEAYEAPWRRPSHKVQPRLDIAGPLPTVIRVVMSARLFVPKAELPSSLLNAIKRLAAFQNPEFYKKQSLRLSTASTPRIIACAEDFPLHVALPRGCLDELKSHLQSLGVAIEIEDLRTLGAPMPVQFVGTLSDPQREALAALAPHDIGLLVAPPGSGKTVIGIALIAERACSTLVLVHRQSLLDQWRAQLALFLGLDAREIGQIGAGKRSGNGRIDVAMIQSLIRHGEVSELLDHYGQVIVDECHHVPAVSFERVLSAASGRYLLGLTATPQRRDGHQRITEMQLGPVRHEISGKGMKSSFVRELWVRETSFRAEPTVRPRIQDLYSALAADPDRNRQILDDVIESLAQGRSPIVLTERTDHLELLAGALKGFARHIVVLHGGMSPKARKKVLAELAAIPPTHERLLLATGRYLGEGFDDARLDTLFLTLPVSWKGTLTQYAGRLHRLHSQKSTVRIIDYVDRHVPMLLSMFAKRIRGYRAIGYTQQSEVPLARSKANTQITVEFDDDPAYGEAPPDGWS